MNDTRIHLSMTSRWVSITQDDGTVVAVLSSHGDSVRFIGTPDELRHLYESLILADHNRRHPDPARRSAPATCWTGD